MSLNARINPVLRHSLRELLRRPPLAVAMLGVPGLALAGPTGEDVIRGSADITRPDAQRTNITQHTDRAVINWQTFNVDADEFVTFFQPGASSIVLNRVLGGDASYILGHIEANGQVFLLNPHGVFFTHGASLDVQGFLGSTLDMDPDAFMAGDFSLTRNGASPSTAQVINDGTLSAGPGGYIVLAGDFTENTGVITANAGTVALVSGNALTLDIEGDGLVNFAVNEATLSEAAGVHNAGSLIADGGRVIMTAKVANDLVATAVNNEGLVRAHAIEERNGEIYLVGNGGDVVNSGMLDADGENAGGGTIIVYGNEDVTLANGATQTVAGDDNHEGGFMRFIAEDRLDYQQGNTIRATGGISGGFVEVSGHGSINLRGIPDIGPGGHLLIDPQLLAITDNSAAPQFNSSTTGYAFIGAQPSYAGSAESITGVGRGWIEGQLDTGVTVSLVASEAIFVDALTPVTITATGGGNLNFFIGNVGSAAGASSAASGVWNGTGGQAPSIVPSSDPDTHQFDLGDLNINVAGNVSLDAGTTGTVTIGAITTPANVTLTGSTIQVGSGFNGISDASFVTINGNVVGSNLVIGSSANGVEQININGNVNVTSGASLHALGGNGQINVTGSISAGGGGGIWLNADGTVTGGGNIFVGSRLWAANDIRLNANGSAAGDGGNIDIQGGGISGGGLVTLSATGGTLQGGNITIIGQNATGITGNGITITANGNGTSNDLGNAIVMISGQVQGGAGNISINATQNGSGRGGIIDITGNGSAGQLRSQAVTLTASGTGTAASNPSGGRIEIGSGNTETSFAGASIIALSGNIDISATAIGNDNGGVIVAGAMNAAGGINLTADGTSFGGGRIRLGDYSGTLTAADVMAGGNVVMNVHGDRDARLDAGNISGADILINVDLANHSVEFGHASVRVANLTATGGNISVDAAGASSGNAFIDAGLLDATGNIGLDALAALSSTNAILGEGHLNIAGVDGGGTVILTTRGITTGNISVTGAAIAGGSMSINAHGDNGGGEVDVGSITAGQAVTVSALAEGSGSDGGNITISSGVNAGGDINMDAVAGSNGAYGGNIKVNGGGITTTGGLVDLFGTGGGVSGGNISVVGVGTTGIVATNGIKILAVGLGSPSPSIANGTVNIVGQVRGGAGAVNINAGNISEGNGGNIVITGTGSSAGLISGATISITASGAFGSGTGTSSGQIHLGNGSPEANFAGAQVTATVGQVFIDVVGGRGVITVGDINAVGSVSIGANGNQGHVHLGDYAGNVLTTPGNITAGTSVTVDVTGNDARIDAGNITAGNTMNLGAHAQPGGSAAITVGTLANTGTSISGNINLTVGSASAGSPVVGTLDVGGVTAAHTLNINITPGSGGLTLDNLTGINDNLQINTTVGANIGTANFAGGFTYTGGNTNIDFGGTFTAGGNVFVDATTLSAQSGITIGAADLTFNNAVTAMSGANIVATGNVDIRTSGSAGSITIGDVSGVGVRIDAFGTAANYGNVTLGNVSGTGMVDLIANDDVGGGGQLVAASVTGGSISMLASTDTGSGGAIVITGNTIATAGGISAYASNAGGAGTIKFGGDASAAGDFFANVFGVGTNNTLEIHGNVTAGNNLDFGSGVDHLFFGTGSHTLSAGGNLQIGDVADMVNGGAVNYSASGDIFINATDVLVGNVTAGGIVQINGNGGTTHTIGNVSANHIDMHFGPPSGGAVTVTTGDLAATGTASFNRDIVVQMHGGSTGTTANLTLGDVTTANGEVVLTVFEGVSGSGAGNLTAGAISAERFARIVARGDVTTGAITINNAAGAANLQIQSHTGSSSAAVGGDITINGNLTMTGRGEALSPQGAFVRLDAGAGTSVITVTGDVSVSVAGGAFSFSGTDSSGNPVTMSGLMGAGGVQMNSRFGTVNLGNVYVDTVGEGFIDVQALHVSAGDIALNVADGSFTHEAVLTSCSGSPCNITRTETTTGNGRGEVHLGYYGVAIDGTLDFGNVTVNAGDARFNANGFANITGNAITVNATGGDLTQTSTGTFAGNAINYTETGNGGGAEVSLRTTPAGSVTLAGALDVNAQGRGQVNIGAATVSVQDVTVTATGGTFTRTGQPVPQEVDDGPFGEGMDNGGPRIDEGTITGGMAQIHISGVPSSSSMTSGDVLANSVTVNGALSVSAPGAANIHVAANNVTVTGALVAAAGAVVQDGTRFEEYLDSTGDTIKVASTVQSSYGEAHVSVNGSAAGVINVGDITVSGPVAGGHVEGGDVTLGAITITGTGGDLNVEETTTNVTAGTVSNFTFDGPALLTGFGIQGAGDVTVGGDIALSAVGAGGMIISGDTVSLQNVTLNVTDGNYEILDTEIFGATAHAFTLGDVLLDINAATTATVNGNVSITAGHTARVGGEYTATGTISIDAGKNVTSSISTEVQYLHAIDDEGESDPLALSGPMNVAATNIAINATAGNLDLSGVVLDAGGALVLASGGDIDLSTLNVSAGDSLAIATMGNLTFAADNYAAATSIIVDVGGTFAATGTTFTSASIEFSGGTGTVFDASTNTGSLTLGTAAGYSIDNTANAGATVVDVVGTIDGIVDVATSNAIAVNAISSTNLALVTNAASIILNAAGDVSLDNSGYASATNISFGSATPTALTLTFGGDAAFASDLSAGTLTVTGTNLDLSGRTVSASNTISFDLSGDLGLTNTNLTASALDITVGGSITNAGSTGSITAGGAAITAGGSIDLTNTVMTVGAGVAPGATGDAELLSLLAIEGLAPTSSAPNLVVSGANVTLGDLAFNGDYLLLQADTLTLSGTVTTSQADTLVQLAPLATSTTISVLDSGTGAGTVDYSNAGHLSRFAGDTIALGTTAHTGNITLAENNAGIDIGATNLFVLTSGTVTGLDRVISSGVVKDLATLIGGGGFEVPQTDEIDTSQDVVQTLNEEYALDDGGSGDDEEDEGDEEGEDTDTDATVEEEGDSLIRQDTVDEEMMCS